MQMIAREFNFSETVFLRRNTDGAVAINIFTPVNEMDFAGHPVIGTGHVLFRQLLPGLAVHSSEATLWTNAGPVVPSLFTAISAGPSQLTELDEGWAPSFTGVMYYRVLSDPYDESGKKVQHLRIRMIAIGLEDPACGSGSCALGAYLALQQGDSGGMRLFPKCQPCNPFPCIYVASKSSLEAIQQGVMVIRLLFGNAILSKERSPKPKIRRVIESQSADRLAEISTQDREKPSQETSVDGLAAVPELQDTVHIQA
ncbi:hypothetical protein FOXG_09934 [Fusarium oxysporum f. sp. lycopersici 4287]|uniref:Phenazine biosynthesis protein n=2 Tax=Fusarium oxysporum TaxID=5507 RepID=A0A0J9VEI9_FUSO4|nr:hypothetical protein FOXG_09934 [Fusarium oxysporum f. sp. lycopersici 4287]KNB09331.1 hypothetical protein FOXG_09934 [Fusarium oxysporum f. sp. lycopersici 4287]